MTAPQRYRSVFTGTEIDSILSSVKTKIDASLIVTNFNGGTNLIASAETVKILYTSLQQFNDPNYIKQLIISVPGNNLFTDEYKNKIDGISDKFKGSFANAAARDVAINATNFAGGEIVFLMDDGSDYHLQAWTYWDNLNGVWKKSILTKTGDVTPVSVATAGTAVTTTVDKTLYSTMKAVVYARKGLQLQAVEVLLSSNGTDVYYTVYGELANTSLFTLSVDIVGNSIRLLATTTTTSVTIYIKKLAEF